jgi:hypothetical protein
VQFNCIKKLHEKLNFLWHSTGFPSGLSFFDSSVCLLVRVTMVDKKKGAAVCCLLATSAIMLSEKEEKKA